MADERKEIDRLGRYWDAVARGGPAPRDDLDPGLAEAVRRFQELGAAPTPDSPRGRVWRAALARADMRPRPEEAPVQHASMLPIIHPAFGSNGRATKADVQRSRPCGTVPSPRTLWAHFATAALLLLTLASGYLAFGRPGGRPGVDGWLGLPAVVAPAATADTTLAVEPLLRATTEKLPNGPISVGLMRVTYAPNASDAPAPTDTPLSPSSGPEMILVESGQVAVAATGDVTVGRAADGRPSPDGPAISLANPTLGPGDWTVVPAGLSRSLRNSGETPATVLEVFVGALGIGGSSSSPDGVTYDFLGSRDGTILPAGPALLTLSRTTLPPHGSLPPAANGAFQVAVPAEPFGPSGVATAPDGSARNLGEQPTVAYVLTIAPLSAAAPAGTLLDASLGQVPTGRVLVEADRWHVHPHSDAMPIPPFDGVQVYAVQSGRVVFAIGGSERTISAGDHVVVRGEQAAAMRNPDRGGGIRHPSSIVFVASSFST